MDVKQFLLEQGYSEADAVTLAADDKMSRAISGAINRWTEADTARQEADRLKKEADEATRRQNEFWTGEAVPALTKAEGRVASAEAERSRLQSYLQSLKNQGYEVPAEYPFPGSHNPFDYRRKHIMSYVKRNGHWFVALFGIASLAYSAGTMQMRLPALAGATAAHTRAAAADTHAVKEARELSTAFRQAAKDALPAMVSPSPLRGSALGGLPRSYRRETLF